ncbi:MAG: hypothetical protein Fur0037_13660 [Planctomycetota bacterium]
MREHPQYGDAVLDPDAMASALRAARVGLFDWSCASDLVRWSPGIEALLGEEGARRAGRFQDFLSLVHADDRRILRSRIMRAMADAGTRQEMQFRLAGTGLARPGSSWVWGCALAEKGPDGIVCRVIGALVDVHGMKESDERRLEEMRLQSTWALAAGVAQDFEDLLAVVQQEGELLAGSTARDPKALFAALQRGRELTRRLLEFARLHEQRLDTLEIDTVILGLEERIRAAMGASVETRIRIVPPLGSIRADRELVECLVLHLVDNARKAMSAGGTLLLQLDQIDGREAPLRPGIRPGRWVRLLVRDQGEGMDLETRERAFEPLFTTRKGSMGLGLSTCHGIVHRCGGHMWIESEPGSGTTVTVLFPPGERLVERPAVRAGEEGRAPPRILFVDRDDALRTVVSGVLRQAGFQVLTASSGDEALHLAERHDGPIRLLIADFGIPGIGGHELAARLRRRRPGIDVLFLTRSRDQTIEVLDRDETAKVLPKPFTARQLVGRVGALLGYGEELSPANV